MNADTSGPGSAAVVPGLEGWFTTGPDAHLIGMRCDKCGTYYFPRTAKSCRNPDCTGGSLAEVPLSRSGKLWSFTNACYAPPEPYVAPDPYAPFAIAAVELEREKMIVLGQVVTGVGVEQLRAGMTMQLVVEPLTDGKLVWKWKPA